MLADTIGRRPVSGTRLARTFARQRPSVPCLPPGRAIIWSCLAFLGLALDSCSSMHGELSLGPSRSHGRSSDSQVHLFQRQQCLFYSEPAARRYRWTSVAGCRSDAPRTHAASTRLHIGVPSPSSHGHRATPGYSHGWAPVGASPAMETGWWYDHTTGRVANFCRRLIPI